MTDRSFIWQKKLNALLVDHPMEDIGDHAHLAVVAGYPADQLSPLNHGEHDRRKFIIIPSRLKFTALNPISDNVRDDLLADLYGLVDLLLHRFIPIVRLHTEGQHRA